MVDNTWPFVAAQGSSAIAWHLGMTCQMNNHELLTLTMQLSNEDDDGMVFEVDFGDAELGREV
jgi:hypothetical protein